ncbi:helix-turn-helix domain-containing protein [Janibacter indicus]
MTVTDEQVGARIKARREEIGHSQTHVGAIMTIKGFKGWSGDIVSRVELGKRPLRFVEAVGLCEPALLGVPLEYLTKEG